MGVSLNIVSDLRGKRLLRNAATMIHQDIKFSLYFFLISVFLSVSLALFFKTFPFFLSLFWFEF